MGTPSQPKPEERHFVLKMWRDGFSVDGGELRKYQDPARWAESTCWTHHGL